MKKSTQPTQPAESVPGYSSKELIRSMVRGNQDFQRLRIQMGNRVTANFKRKLGFKSDGMTEDQLSKQAVTLLKKLKDDYLRITDGIIIEGEDFINAKLPPKKKFVPGILISEYTELVLVHHYITLMNDEIAQSKQIEACLTGIPIYDQYLKDVTGCGRTISGILISEIDIEKSQYPSSLWKYAGVDVVIVGYYTNSKGEEKIMSGWDIDSYILLHGQDCEVLAEGKYPVTLTGVGRTRKEECLVMREYLTKDKKTTAWRKSITYNPLLKTKLLGVLAGSFLMQGKVFVDGQNMGVKPRLELAVSLGYEIKKPEEDDLETVEDQKTDVMRFLEQHGFEVVEQPTKYGQIYYDYRNRLNNSPHHQSKTKQHRHNMAIRYMIKRFLVDFYVAYRTLEKLPVMPEYSEAKLGLTHGKATFEKQRYYENRKAA